MLKTILDAVTGQTPDTRPDGAYNLTVGELASQIAAGANLLLISVDGRLTARRRGQWPRIIHARLVHDDEPGDPGLRLATTDPKPGHWLIGPDSICTVAPA